MVSFEIKSILSFIIVFLGFFDSVWAHSAEVEFQKILKFSDIKYYQFSKFSDVLGVEVLADHLVTFDGEGQHYYRTLFRRKNLDPDLALTNKVGGVSDSSRVAINLGGNFKWIALKPFLDGISILFSSDLSALAIQKNKTVNRESIIVDRIRPAADSRGEPTRREVSHYRKKITSSIEGLSIRGVAKMSAPDQDGSQYIAVTNLTDFRVITLKCSSKRVGHCFFNRTCFLADSNEGFGGEYVAGIGLWKNSKYVLIGDRQYNRIFIYKKNTCHDIRQIAVMDLPEKIGKIRSIFVDSSENLWVSVDTRDFSLSASVYMWPNHKWLKAKR